MLVTFHSKAWSSITMFGEVATTLLKMAGHSGTVPGAFRAGDIPAALARLQQALAAAGSDDKNPPDAALNSKDADEPPPVGLRLRAYPLIHMLSAAAVQECDVMWEAGAAVL